MINGVNTTTLLITSSSSGGVELKVKARKDTLGGVVELPTVNLMVQAEDLGRVGWYSAEIMCKSSIIAGYSDWRLPTIEELMTLYNNREYIGGFDSDISNGVYWSASLYSNSGTYQVVHFWNGFMGFADSNYNGFKVRAVRTIN